MTQQKIIGQAGLALMPLLAIPTWIIRDGWEQIGIWLAALAWSFWLRSWWWRVFLWLALIQLIWHPAAISYKNFAMIAIFLGAAQVFSTVSPERLLAAIRIAGISVLALMGLQELEIIPLYNKYGVVAAFFNPDSAGVFLALCMPAFFLSSRWRGKRLQWPWLLPILLVAAVATRSETAMITAFLMLAVFAAWCTGRKYKRFVILGILILANLTLCNSNPVRGIIEDVRWTIWRHTVQTYRSAPLGRGLGSFQQIFPFFTASDKRITSLRVVGRIGTDKVVSPHVVWKQAHNEYLQAGFEMGLQAIVLIAGFLGWFAIIAWQRTLRLPLRGYGICAAAGIVALAVSSFGWFTFHIVPLALVGMAWLGMWEREAGRLKAEGSRLKADRK